VCCGPIKGEVAAGLHRERKETPADRWMKSHMDPERGAVGVGVALEGS